MLGATTRLFANSEPGIWLDPDDIDTLFQDSAGTTPVTAAGDPVGLALDKSGNGNHATQSTAAARPIYRVDATTDLGYLEFDGVDDFLVTPTITPGWKDANGTPFWVTSFEASEEWMQAAGSALDRPEWDTENEVNETGAKRAQAAMVLWTGPGDDPDNPTPIPQATVGKLTVVAGMDGLAALAAMGLVRTETEGVI